MTTPLFLAVTGCAAVQHSRHSYGKGCLGYAAHKKKTPNEFSSVRYRRTRATGGNPAVKAGGMVLQYRSLDPKTGPVLVDVVSRYFVNELTSRLPLSPPFSHISCFFRLACRPRCPPVAPSRPRSTPRLQHAGITCSYHTLKGKRIIIALNKAIPSQISSSSSPTTAMQMN